MMTLPLIKAPPPAKSRLWLWILLGVLVLLIVVVVIVIVKRRRVPEPMPEPVMEAAPAGPLKTIMLGIGGEQDSMPIVGWIVPLAGEARYQTFKLMAGSTKLGSGGASHIVVGDSFMSTEHAEIVASPSGFILNDLGSTNGSFALAGGEFRRIANHELLDNDVFRLGKTDFKFKSIN
jgi:hypothetical protein